MYPVRSIQLSLIFRSMQVALKSESRVRWFIFVPHHDDLQILHCKKCAWLEDEKEYHIQFDFQISISVAFSKSFAWSVLKSRELANWGWFPAEFDFQEILAQGNLQNSWHSDAFVDSAKGDFIIKGFRFFMTFWRKNTCWLLQLKGGYR